MVDRILDFEADAHVTAVKNVSRESDVVEHHFQGYPLWPGCMTLESMAQVGGYLIMRSALESQNQWVIAALASVSRATFKRPVFPGDQMLIKATLGEVSPNTAEITAVARVDKAVVAKARFVLVHRPLDAVDNADSIAYLTRLFNSMERKGGLIE
tara:strand:- start:11 stop:475 length:465 start_codon:yes stop_codon:yes gene_type:complete